MNNFKVEDFTLVCKFIACRGFDEFAKMYEDIGFIGEWYAKEKPQSAKLSARKG
jgi:hypothetical protein